MRQYKDQCGHMTQLYLEKDTVFCFAQPWQFSALKKEEFQVCIDLFLTSEWTELAPVLNCQNNMSLKRGKRSYFNMGGRLFFFPAFFLRMWPEEYSEWHPLLNFTNAKMCAVAEPSATGWKGGADTISRWATFVFHTQKFHLPVQAV